MKLSKEGKKALCCIRQNNTAIDFIFYDVIFIPVIYPILYLKEGCVIMLVYDLFLFFAKDNDMYIIQYTYNPTKQL